MKDCYKKCRYNGKRMRAHRAIVMATLGMALTSDMIVHHKDGDKCNNNPSNLEIMTQSEHARLHSLAERRDAFGRFARRAAE